jgi:hypothetical protein
MAKKGDRHRSGAAPVPLPLRVEVDTARGGSVGCQDSNAVRVMSLCRMIEKGREAPGSLLDLAPYVCTRAARDPMRDVADWGQVCLVYLVCLVGQIVKPTRRTKKTR